MVPEMPSRQVEGDLKKTRVFLMIICGLGVQKMIKNLIGFAKDIF